MSRDVFSHSDVWNAVIAAVLDDVSVLGTGAVMVSRDGEQASVEAIPYEGMYSEEIFLDEVGA